MSKIPTIAEQKLADLQPNKLDEDFMSRLLASADGSLTELSDAELQFENSLRKFSPPKLSSSFDTTLIDILTNTPFHVDEKIVLFHKSTSRASGTISKFRRFNLAAAAAVALLGSLAAWITPNQPNETVANTPERVVQQPSAIPPAAPSSFAPASINRNLSDTQDEGVMWNQSNRPHRVIRFTYMDRVTLKNEKGELIEVEQPRVEYVIIPEKID
ncbi:MAG: hypothetical protein V4727_06815 [Verrucomicrobiota bacterium]